MLVELFKKIKEALISVLPVTLIVLILNFTPILNLTNKELTIFIISALFLIIGIGLFSLGADMAMSPMGEQVGSGITKTKSLKIVLIICFMLGLFITIAEPDLKVLAGQVSFIPDTALIVTVGVGVAIFLVLSILKIVFKKNLSQMLMFFYLVLFALSAILLTQGKENFLALSFDSGGVTTGPITVPFIMALGVGIASVLGGKNTNENSFGLVAMCSVGPILAVMFLGIIFDGGELPDYVLDYALKENILEHTIHELCVVTKDVTIALGLVVLFFFIIQFICLKLPKKKLIQIGVGVIYTFLGLIIFLTAVSVGFMPIGYKMGTELAAKPEMLAIFGFILGFVVVLAEPAVHVLNKQVEEITDGMVSKKSMLIALSIGVGISIGLSMIRIIFDFSILYYLIPGYIISLGLSFFVPRIYTAIAFDSGGVASGPLTSTFILPFAIGACFVLQGQEAIYRDGFGIVAMVAMTPLITIQLLGFKSIMTRRVQEKIAMRRILDADDEQVIDFM